MKFTRAKFGIILLAMLLTSCSGPVTTPIPSPPPTQIPPEVEKPELGNYFEGFDGAFVLVNGSNGQTTRYNPQGCAEELLPFSTFKVLNAMIGLESGVIPDEKYVIPWNGTQYPTAAWNKDQTLQTAIRDSVVWYFQELARRVGQEKMQQYINAVGYGNQDISGKIDSFWLTGGLRISADEQVVFLQRLYHGDLPFSARSMQIVKKIIVLDQAQDYQLSGKTGSGKMGDLNIGWFIGYVELKDDVYFFATNIRSTSQDSLAPQAREISEAILRGMGILP